MKTQLPPDVAQNIIEILYYAAAALVGWVAKWLQSRKSNSNLKK